MFITYKNDIAGKYYLNRIIQLYFVLISNSLAKIFGLVPEPAIFHPLDLLLQLNQHELCMLRFSPKHSIWWLPAGNKTKQNSTNVDSPSNPRFPNFTSFCHFVLNSGVQKRCGLSSYLNPHEIYIWEFERDNVLKDVNS